MMQALEPTVYISVNVYTIRAYNRFCLLRKDLILMEDPIVVSLYALSIYKEEKSASKH